MKRYISPNKKPCSPFHRMPSSATAVWLETLKKSDSKLQQCVIKYGPVEAVLAICELALNLVSGNLKAKHTKAQRKWFEKLADRSIPVQRKKRFLSAHPQGKKLLRLLIDAVRARKS